MDGKVETQTFGTSGYGMGGYGGFPIFGLFGALGLNNGGLFGNNAAVADSSLNQRITDLQIAGVNQNINSAEANLTNATLMQTNNLGQLIMDGDNGIVNTVRTVGDVLASQTGGVKDAVQNSMFQQALFGKDFALSQCAQTTELKDAIVSQGEMTRSLITEKTIQDLRDRNQSLQTAYDFASRGLMEATGPTMSVIQPNPCRDRGIEQDITVINNQLGLLNQNQTELATALKTLVNK